MVFIRRAQPARRFSKPSKYRISPAPAESPAHTYGVLYCPATAVDRRKHDGYENRPCQFDRFLRNLEDRFSTPCATPYVLVVAPPTNETRSVNV